MGQKIHSPSLFFLIFLITSGFIIGLPLSAQDKSIPSDLVIVLDVSGSMGSSGIMPSVKKYLKTEAVDSILKPGDRCTLMVFGESPRVLVSRNIESQADKQFLLSTIDSIRADDQFTDIGTALEKLSSVLASHTDGAYRPIALFITDGKNAPPPSSPFSGKDLSVDQHFKELGRKISMKGWQLYVVGLGSQTDAPAVASAVEGSTLAPLKEALNPEGLSTYVSQVDETAKSWASEPVPPSEKPSVPNFSETSKGAVRFPIFLVFAAAVVIGIILFFFFRSRKKDGKEEGKP